MTTPIVTELRRNGNTTVERPRSNSRPPARRLPGRAPQTQPHTQPNHRLQLVSAQRWYRAPRALRHGSYQLNSSNNNNTTTTTKEQQ